MKLFLANIDYRQHMTDEGDQLQRGFESAGWVLAGAGYGDGTRRVPALIARHQPSMVLVHDKRDWDPQNPGCFNGNVGFLNLGELRRHPEIFKVAVVKDAGSMLNYHRAFCEEIAADAILTYYHDTSVTRAAPWMDHYRRVRTYHTVDRETVEMLDLSQPRKRAVISGALNVEVYPLRHLATHEAQALGCDVLRHPGYHNHGNRTAAYLATLAGYKVHIATASRYRFALRKIIESVAAGATPVTNLPDYDVLPEIDGALVRVSSASTAAELRQAIDQAEREWRLSERLEYAAKACRFYDYRAMGERVSRRLDAVHREHLVVASS